MGRSGNFVYRVGVSVACGHDAEAGNGRGYLKCGVFSCMAFIAGGISVIYQLEQLPKAMAALIQMAVLYVDYLGIYLLNGWLPLNAIPVFTLIFAVGFAAIWAMIYLYVKRTVSDLNEKIKR